MSLSIIKRPFFLWIFAANIFNIQATLPLIKKPVIKKAENYLNAIFNDYQKLRVIFSDALETDVLKEKELEEAIKRLEESYKKINIIENLDTGLKNNLKGLVRKIVNTYTALLEEAYVFDLWTRDYEGYEADLQNNFSHLPNQHLQKPDFKKLYEELGFKPGQKVTFNEVRQKYQERYDELKKKAGNNFENDYFRPYLRVLDYIFRTPYSKVQYDIYLQGEQVYNNKAKKLKSFKPSVKKVLENTDLAMLSGTLNSL